MRNDIRPATSSPARPSTMRLVGGEKTSLTEAGLAAIKANHILHKM